MERSRDAGSIPAASIFSAGKFLTGTYFPSYELISMVCVFYKGNLIFFPFVSVFISVGIVIDDDATKFTLANDAP